mmetsp:Transcript_20703/g.57241  ORF Transcript_20703/g.57241 Transcript_20703/m.57241 type:complete len:251 (-) Transcript_20703:4-756(-)
MAAMSRTAPPSTSVPRSPGGVAGSSRAKVGGWSPWNCNSSSITRKGSWPTYSCGGISSTISRRPLGENSTYILGQQPCSKTSSSKLRVAAPAQQGRLVVPGAPLAAAVASSTASPGTASGATASCLSSSATGGSVATGSGLVAAAPAATPTGSRDPALGACPLLLPPASREAMPPTALRRSMAPLPRASDGGSEPPPPEAAQGSRAFAMSVWPATHNGPGEMSQQEDWRDEGRGCAGCAAAKGPGGRSRA